MRRLVASLAAVGLLTLVPVPPVAHAAASPTLPGIDVSQYQNVIDWATVGTTPVRYAILRATKGAAYVDPSYATNLAGATGGGLVVGAYHRATPSLDPGDATAEADHFTATARDAPGDLLPVLDIEGTGGLTPKQLTDWVRTWLLRVRSTLGLRATIYTSPNFWAVHMRDTTWFADHGYPLWIAHWGVDAPQVPGKDWGGHGWTFWQWSSTGAVPGITTAVDRDRYDGTNLGRVRIASLAVTAAPGGVISGPRIDCGGAAARCDRLANPGDVLTLTADPDPGAVFLGWTGACAGSGTSTTCDLTASRQVAVSATFGYPLAVSLRGTGGGTVSSSPSGVACGPACAHVFPAGTTVQLSAVTDSASTFGGWGGACTGSVTTCDLPMDAPTSVTATFTANVTIGEDGAGTAYRWGAFADRRAFGGSYLAERRAGASVVFRFRGGAVTLFTVAGPPFGHATVEIDGASVGAIDGYARTFRAGVAHRYDGLGSGPHTLTVTATGTAPRSATGTRVGVDALRWGGRTRPSPPQISAAWGSIAGPSASEGTAVVSDVPGATATLAFTGTGLSLITERGPNMGRAELWVDGVLQRTVSLYAPTRSYGVLRTVTGLLDGGHVAMVKVLDTHVDAATGSSIVVDGWIIR